MSRSLIITTGIIFALSVFTWLVLVGNVFTMNSSDAAGNGLSQAFASLTVVALWLFLIVLLIVAGRDGRMATSAAPFAFVLVLASGVATMVAVNLLSHTAGRGFHWPVLVPIAAPPAIMLYAAWVVVPALRNAVSPLAMNTIVGVILTTASIAPWPLASARKQQGVIQRAKVAAEFELAQDSEQLAVRAQKQARFDKLTQASPLWLWMDFLDGDSTMRTATIAAISTLPTRQADAELMFARSMFMPMYHLPDLSLQATPALCEGARAFLKDRGEKFAPPKPGDIEFTLEYHRVDLYLPSLKWLVDNHCQLDSEIATIEAGVARYPANTQRDNYLVALKGLRRK